MATHRSAKVASRAVRLAIREGSFKSPDVTGIMTDPPSRQTVTRILRQLEADGWLMRTDSKSSIWRAGPLARRLGDLGDTARQQADRDPIGPE